MNKLGDQKIALVCDWLVGVGGAERVIATLHEMFPEAPIYTSQYNPETTKWLGKADVRTGWLQRLPTGLRKFLPVLRAWYFSHLDLSEYDLVISSSGAEAKAVKTGTKTVHISYCHAPTHYYWIRYEQYLQTPGFGHFNWLARIGLKLLVGPMRRWDKRAAQRPDYLIANSVFTQTQILKYYGRDSVVIHPPVDTARFKAPSEQKRDGYVTAGRQTPYKQFDLAIKACNKLGVSLTVIGDGPEHNNLLRIAGPTIRFVTDVSDAEVAHYFTAARAFIFPTDHEDFGIVPVEAMAAGTPVIAFNGGGPLDYVINGKTGLFFSPLTTKGLLKALELFPSQKFDHSFIANYATQFGIDHFKEDILALLESHIQSEDPIK